MFQRLIPVAVLALRLWTGLNFMLAHGLRKISNPEAFLSGGGMAKFPAPELMGWVAILTEFVGGFLLAMGLFTRAAAVFIIGTMLGAAVVVHGADAWNRKELALTYAAVAFFFLAYGGGKASVDALIGRWRRRGRGSTIVRP